MTAGLIDEKSIIDLLALFPAIATVSIVWYGVKKTFKDEVRDTRFFFDLHRCDCSVCTDRLLRDRHHKLRCDRYTVWLAASVAVTRFIVAADHRFGNFLCRPNAVAMVELA